VIRNWLPGSATAGGGGELGDLAAVDMGGPMRPASLASLAVTGVR
jgi:hypothetical protein